MTIELRHTVGIGVAPDVVWAWLESLPQHYLDWHPDHLEARWKKAGSFVPGAELEVRELLHGKPHRLRMTVTAAESGRWVRYRIGPGLDGELRVEAADGGSEFTAVIRLGAGLPVLRRMIDGLLRLFFGARVEAIRRHQAEEGTNLKDLLEREAGIV